MTLFSCFLPWKWWLMYIYSPFSRNPSFRKGQQLWHTLNTLLSFILSLCYTCCIPKMVLVCYTVLSVPAGFMHKWLTMDTSLFEVLQCLRSCSTLFPWSGYAGRIWSNGRKNRLLCNPAAVLNLKVIAHNVFPSQIYKTFNEDYIPAWLEATVTFWCSAIRQWEVRICLFWMKAFMSL